MTPVSLGPPSGQFELSGLNWQFQLAPVTSLMISGLPPLEAPPPLLPQPAAAKPAAQSAAAKATVLLRLTNVVLPEHGGWDVGPGLHRRCRAAWIPNGSFSCQIADGTCGRCVNYVADRSGLTVWVAVEGRLRLPPRSSRGDIDGERDGTAKRCVVLEMRQHKLWRVGNGGQQRLGKPRLDPVPAPGHPAAHGDPDGIDQDRYVRQVEGELVHERADQLVKGRVTLARLED